MLGSTKHDEEENIKISCLVDWPNPRTMDVDCDNGRTQMVLEMFL